PRTQHARIRLPARPLMRWWERVSFPKVESTTGPVDVVHGPNFFVPPTRAPSVVTVHDLAFVRYPETLKPAVLQRLNRSLRRTVAKASAVIVQSEFTAKELLSWVGEASQIESKVHAVPLGVRPEFLDPSGEAGMSGEPPYLFWSGAIEPRKNLGSLIEALALLRRTQEIRLVIGGTKGWSEDLQNLIKREEVVDAVTFAGYLSNADMARKMASAACFEFPSVYEGFGMPVLEAMAAGTPVVAARSGSIPEVAGDAALLVDPYNVSELAEAIRSILDSESLRKQLIDKGRDRARSFTWEATARATAEVYRQIAN
ncbi:MAG: glycosyltransferase family 4 protein, partial [Acidimicrobiia bacterium]